MELVTIPISTGELLDKITILEIKRERISDEEKLQHIEQEASLLNEAAAEFFGRPDMSALAQQLKHINERLWDVEDKLREHERTQTFDDEFIRLARSVYHLNDERAAVKKEINFLLGSDLVEEKSYSPYSKAAIGS